jgi:hypothetical protein
MIHYGIVHGGHIPREVLRLGDVGAVVHEPVHLGLAVGVDGEEAAEEVKTRTKTAVQTLITAPMASKPSRSLSLTALPWMSAMVTKESAMSIMKMQLMGRSTMSGRTRSGRTRSRG